MPRLGTKPKVKKPGTGLARPGDPLVTGKGELVEPLNKPAPREVKEHDIGVIDPEQYRPKKKRNVKELPAEPRVITAVGAVFMYTMMGVGDREIADSLGTTTEEINRLRGHSAYGECFQIIHSDFINSSSDLLSSRIAAYSHTALRTVGDLAEAGKKEEVRLRASMDLLDRAGVRPKDQAERAMMDSNDLRIIIVDGEKADTGLNIEIDGEA
jgi:hypothetical protein